VVNFKLVMTQETTAAVKYLWKIDSSLNT